MITLNDISSISIPELEENNSFKLNGIWIEYGLNGLLPRIQLDIDGYTAETNFVNFNITLIFSGIKIIETKSCIYSYERVGTRLTLYAYLVPDLEFIRGRKTSSYNSMSELVSSIWSGNIEVEIPNNDNMYLCQLNELNHVYLSKALKCSSAEQSFYYNLFNSIIPVQLKSRNIDYDLTKNDNDDTTVQIFITDNQLLADKNKANFIEEHTTKLVNDSISIAGEEVYFSDDDHIQLEENGIRSKLELARPNMMFNIEYGNNLKFQIGDIIKFKYSNSKTIVAMILSTKMYINMSGITVVSKCFEYE